MRLRFLISIILINIIFLFSCNYDIKKNMKNTSSEIISVFSDEYEELVFDSIRAIPLQTTEGNLLGNNIKVVQQCCDDIYIGDMEAHKRVFRFNKEGNFINAIGVHGRGPEEYLGFCDFTIDRDTVELLAGYGSKSRVVKYLKNGDFISYTPINIVAMSFEKKDSIYIFSTSYQRDRYSNRLHVTNSQGDLKESILPDKSVWNIPITETKFSKYENSILFKEAFDNCVYAFKGGELNIQFQFDFGDYSIRPDSYTKPLMDIIGKLNKEGFGSISNFYESINYFAFEIVLQRDNEPTLKKNVIYNKKTKIIKEHIYSIGDDSCLNRLIGLTNSDELIYLEYPNDIIEKKELFGQLPIINIASISEIKPYDNPVLFYCRIKE